MAVTGKGDFPFISCWLNKNRKDTLRKQIFWADKDQSIQTIMEDWFFEVSGAVYYGILKRWNGSTWIKEPLKTFLGTWLTKPLKRWDGSAWKEIDTTGV